MFHQPFRHIKIGMTFFFFFLFHLEANALVYRVHVNYPYGSGEPRDNQYDTKKDDRKQSVWLKYSKFTCETEAADFEKSFAMTISCKKRGEDSSFESTAICGESVKFTTDRPIMRLKETPPKN